MEKHSWTLKLDLTADVDDGETEVTRTVIEVHGSHDTGGHLVPVNECVAVGMANLMQMLLASNRIVRPSGFADSARSFMDSGTN